MGEQDPFRAPEEGEAPPLELARKADPRSARVEELPQLGPREPVAYRRPSGGPANLVLWALAGVGVLAIVMIGAHHLKTRMEPPKRTLHAIQVRPVEWKSLPMDDAVLITVEVTPKSARLLLDGEPLPSNPARLPRGAVHKLSATAEGYEPKVLEVRADEVKTVRLQLDRAK